MTTTTKMPKTGDVVYAHVGSKRPMILVREVVTANGFTFVEGVELVKPKSTTELKKQTDAGAQTYLHNGKCYLRRGRRTVRLEAIV